MGFLPIRARGDVHCSDTSRCLLDLLKPQLALLPLKQEAEIVVKR